MKSLYLELQNTTRSTTPFLIVFKPKNRSMHRLWAHTHTCSSLRTVRGGAHITFIMVASRKYRRQAGNQNCSTTVSSTRSVYEQVFTGGLLHTAARVLETQWRVKADHSPAFTELTF